MAGMSLLRSAVVSRLQCLQRWPFRSDVLMRRGPPAAAVPVRFGSHGKKLFYITASTYHDTKFKSYLTFYVLLGLIPATIGILLINIFIGPAELAEIPEGYTPEHWEYYRHPITRFLSRNVFHPVDESYEKGMAIIYKENEKRLLRLYEDTARAAMRKRGDGPWYYYETLDKNLIDHEHKSTPDQ
ncbi:PREDICTED: NADH dehydrogenase [ubiquinone] 1 beta subcomplex subunit 5, mitochondrial [Nanorana parkeri]|uniref:NADH dehydrogenase [ubiquinone] 1 beta subcomplex subunit 5, mitochondrial n=1 Tax=Nanorana parkeri TaxID=125878 RepID=UPI000854C20B|nr:PREDICTED: NADH dehydrogenase [ubiquinone] 1 beta subcomplex subunit 5, mitochondrial [Nanorana parkeri]